jgi:hypothetical protein
MIIIQTKKDIWMETQDEVDKIGFVDIEHKCFISLENLLNYINHLENVYGKLGLGIEKLKREINHKMPFLLERIKKKR